MIKCVFCGQPDESGLHDDAMCPGAKVVPVYNSMTSTFRNAEEGFTAEDIAQGQEYSSLGPGYFAGKRLAEMALTNMKPEDVQPILKKAADDFYALMLESVENALKIDDENNVQSKIRAMLDDTVRALLTGQKWALERYPLANYYDGAAIREAIFAQCKDQMVDARVAELEREVANLKSSLAFR